MKRLIVLVFILLGYSCSRGDSVNVELDRVPPDCVSISDYFESIQCVLLEDSPSSHMVPKGRYAYAFGNSSIAILDLFSDFSIRIFDYSGHFITKITKQGRGEGLYGLAYDLLFDEAAGLLVVLDPTGKIVRYSLSENYAFHDEMSFLGPIKAAHNICKLSEDTYVLFSRSEKYQLYISSFKDKKTTPIRYSVPDWLMFSSFTAAVSPLYSYRGVAHYFNGLDGENYTIGNHHMKSYLRWNMGEYRLRERDLPAGKSAKYYQELFTKSSYRYATQFCAMQETDQYIFAEFTFRNQRCNLVYDKTTQSAQTFSRTTEGLRLSLGQFCGNTMYKVTSPDYLHLYLIPDQMMTEKPHNHVLIKYTLR